MAIRYNSDLNKRMASTVSNFNRKVSRAESKGLKRIPQKTSVNYLKSTFTSRADLLRKLKQLDRFSVKDSGQILKVGSDNTRLSNWQFESLKTDRYATIRKLDAELKRQKMIDRVNRRILPSERTRQVKATLKALKVSPTAATASQLNRIQAIIDRYGERRIETDETFYNNFFDMLWSNYNFVGADDDLLQEIEDMMRTLTPQQLLELYNNEKEIKAIVDDYNKYVDTLGDAARSDKEKLRKNNTLESLRLMLPSKIEKYKNL